MEASNWHLKSLNWQGFQSRTWHCTAWELRQLQHLGLRGPDEIRRLSRSIERNMLDDNCSRSERSLGYIISLKLTYLNWGVIRALAMLSSWTSSRLAGEVGMQSPWLLNRAPRLLTLSDFMALVIFAIGYSEFMKYGQAFLLLAITKL